MAATLLALTVGTARGGWHSRRRWWPQGTCGVSGQWQQQQRKRQHAVQGSGPPRSCLWRMRSLGAGGGSGEAEPGGGEEPMLISPGDWHAAAVGIGKACRSGSHGGQAGPVVMGLHPEAGGSRERRRLAASRRPFPHTAAEHKLIWAILPWAVSGGTVWCVRTKSHQDNKLRHLVQRDFRRRQLAVGPLRRNDSQ